MTGLVGALRRPIRQAILRRRPATVDGTIGDLLVQDVDPPTVPVEVARFFSCERRPTGPFPDIPAGRYVCRYTKSARLSLKHGFDFYTYEVTGVPGRSGIRIHSANVASQLEGCIALGTIVADFGGVRGVADSREAVSDFEHLMDHQDFWLGIEEAA